MYAWAARVEQIMIQNIVWQNRQLMEIFNSFNNYWNIFANTDTCIERQEYM